MIFDHPSINWQNVAVAIIYQRDGKVLLGQRPAGKPYAGYWEFPGGKVEVGESPMRALHRELHEELGIDVAQAYPWLVQTFAYPHANVKLHFFRVTDWHGQLHGKENQAISWESVHDIRVAPLLPANDLVLKALKLPDAYAITNAAELGWSTFMRSLEQALSRGLRLIQIREKNLEYTALKRFVNEVSAACNSYNAQLLINNEPALADKFKLAGVHYPAPSLMALTQRPPFELCGCSCHTTSELMHAVSLGLDFAVVSPVKRTQSHPEKAPLGWNGFAEIIREPKIPVYALGGLNTGDLQSAWEHAAHGVAMLSAVWRNTG